MKISSIIILLHQVISQSSEDFIALKRSIRRYISENPVEIAPVLVRIAFHDLFNFDPSKGVGRPHGCLYSPIVANFTDNAPLSGDAIALRDWVTNDETVNIHKISMGDLLSFAGKIAMEETTPCLQFKWKFGRGNCDFPQDEINNPPNGTLNTLEKFDPFLKRYNFTATEMAILTAGTHGIATAAAALENSGFGPFDFTLTNSGQDWIKNTINGEWKQVTNENDLTQFTARFGKNTFMRLPSDFVFFPKKLQSFKATTFDLKLSPVQDYLETFIDKDRSVFDREFKAVFEKMLNIGTDPSKMTLFAEPLDESRECTDEYYPPLMAYAGFNSRNIVAMYACGLSLILGLFGLIVVTAN